MKHTPIGQPSRPYLRGRFFVRRHRLWGAAVCWYQWLPSPRTWATNWGIACKTIREAKRLRRFLNARVARYPRGPGVPFVEAVRFVLSTQ